MDISESLTNVAESAIALAGFTGLLTAFQRRQMNWSDQERFRIRMLLMVCFGIMAFAFMPKVFVDSVIAEDRMWRLLTIGWSLFAIFLCGRSLPSTLPTWTFLMGIIRGNNSGEIRIHGTGRLHRLASSN